MKRIFSSGGMGPVIFAPARTAWTRGATTIRVPRQPPARRGSMLLEVIVSAAMLGTLLVTINQTLVQLQRQTRFADRQFVAQQTLENLLEEFTQRPWSEMTSASVDKIKLSDFTQAKLPAARLGGEVALQSDPVPAKRITLRLNWQNVPGVEQRPWSLTTWVYRQRETAP